MLVRSWLIQNASRLILIIAGILAPLTLFGLLAEDVAEQEAFSFDEPIQMFVRARSTDFLDTTMYWVTQAGSVYAVTPFTLLLLVWLIKRGRRWDAAFWSISVTGAAIINHLAKLLFARARPSLWTSQVHETSYSFPSGHVMSTMAVFAALCVLVWPTKWRWPVVYIGGVFIGLVGASRVYLGVHYPSDVFAGWAASLAWVMALKLMLDHRGQAMAARSES